MSSASADAVPRDSGGGGRKLLLHVAENGHTFEFECDASTPVEAIKYSVEHLSGVPSIHQLLLCLNSWLEPHKTLGHYNLPRDDLEVFLFNKSGVALPDEPIDVPNAARPPPSSPSPHPLDDAADPALKALASYEQQFRHHFKLAHAVFPCTQVKFELCRRLLRELQVQERALEALQLKLGRTYSRFESRYSEFLRCQSRQQRCHSDLLANLGRDVDRLRMTKLHPALQTESYECLFDFVKECDPQKLVEECTDSMCQFAPKISQLKLQFEEFNKGVQNLLSIKTLGGCKDLERMIQHGLKNVDEQRCIMQSLSKDVDTVKNLVNDCLNRQHSASLRPHDAISALGPMYNIHEKINIPKVQNIDHEITKVLDSCKKKKDEMNLLVYTYVKNVARAQYSIKEINSQVHAYRELMGQQDNEFANLKFIHGISNAYRACLAEIIRRKSYLKFYMGLAGQLVERLAAERMSEVKRREDFFTAWNKYIPSDILTSMGLSDSPSQCVVNITPFDTNLLEVDIIDVDRFAPLSPKYENEGPKNYVATSTDSCHLAKSGDAIVNYDFVELLGGFESVNISGTSKLDVENAYLKSELASAIAQICSLSTEVGCDSLDDSKLGNMLKTMTDKMSEALHLKDEYVKHLKSELNAKRTQCLSYEKRVQELEHALLHSQKLSVVSKSATSELKNDGHESEETRVANPHIFSLDSELMDEASCTSTQLEQNLVQTGMHSGSSREGEDDNMMDLSGTLDMQTMESSDNRMDATMLNPARDEKHRVGYVVPNQVCDTHKEEKMSTQQPSLTITDSMSADCIGESLSMLSSKTAAEQSMESNGEETVIFDLQISLADKSNQCCETENKLKSTLEEIDSLKRELDISRNCLDEAQMNCAHLEDILHEAREVAHTNICAADRRASEYSALRSSTVKMRSLFERFHNCVTASGGVYSFVEALHSLAVSLARSNYEIEDHGMKDFHICLTVLADKVVLLSRHRAELLTRCSRAEAAQEHTLKELEEKKELIKSLFSKLQLDKQANEEKISFGHFELHELAAFVMNSSGHYEAISRNCSNYFLSAESVALFSEQCPRPAYIIGQIVHIERQIVRADSRIRSEQGGEVGSRSCNSSQRSPLVIGLAMNVYNLPMGSEYFIVTVAMLPGIAHPSFL